jgi:hypothetical protein
MPVSVWDLLPVIWKTNEVEKGVIKMTGGGAVSYGCCMNCRNMIGIFCRRYLHGKFGLKAGML